MGDFLRGWGRCFNVTLYITSAKLFDMKKRHQSLQCPWGELTFGIAFNTNMNKNKIIVPIIIQQFPCLPEIMEYDSWLTNYFASGENLISSYYSYQNSKYYKCWIKINRNLENKSTSAIQPSLIWNLICFGMCTGLLPTFSRINNISLLVSYQ